MQLTNQLTKGDLDFLKSLGKELKTQDNRATRKPLVFQIRKVEKELYRDPSEYDCCVLIGDEKSTATFFEFEGKTKDLNNIREYLYTEHGFDFDELEEADIDGIQELCENANLYFALTGYEEVIKHEQFFITENEAQKVLAQYDDAFSLYIEHGRSYELERLLEIVEKFAEDDEQ